MKIQSTFALLDVKRGRVGLLKACGGIEGNARIPVTITGFITGAWGHDDGESREFEIEVSKAEISPKATTPEA